MASSILTVPNETDSSTSRVTVDGRHLTYELKVIQQPERARACGSGAKCATSTALSDVWYMLTFAQLPQTVAP